MVEQSSVSLSVGQGESGAHLCVVLMLRKMTGWQGSSTVPFWKEVGAGFYP